MSQERLTQRPHDQPLNYLQDNNISTTAIVIYRGHDTIEEINHVAPAYQETSPKPSPQRQVRACASLSLLKTPNSI